jgi:hypothetical protein
MLIYVEKKMAIWSKPEDEHYRGPAIYRLIVNGQNYCGKTFKFKPRMRSHKCEAEHWKKNLDEGKNVQDVYKAVAGNWDDVVIEIITRYPDKRKGVEADELFMCEREIEAIAFYDSFHNGLNMDEGGRLGVSQRMMGNQYGAEYSRRPEVRAATSQRMIGNNFNASRRKSLTATQGTKTWNFSSSLQATQQLAIQFKENFDQSSISKACRGKYSKANLHVYKGITFKYD